MAAYNVIAAKKAGLTDEDIAKYLAERDGYDYAGAVEAGLGNKDIINYLNAQDMSLTESFMAGAQAEALSEVQGAKQLFGGELSDEQIAQENLARISAEENPVSTLLGRFVGGLVNPSTLIPGSLFFKGGAAALAAGGALGGAVAGGLRPVTDEEDMGRLASTALGGALGGTIGGVLGAVGGALGRKFGKDVAEDAGQAVESAAVESATAAEKPRYRGAVDPDSGEIVYKEIQPAVQQIEEAPIPTQPVAQEVGQVQQNVFDVAQLPKLPNYLQGAKPRFAKSELGFETDIDRALYIVGNPTTKSNRHKEYVDFLSSALNKPVDEVEGIARQVRKEVIEAGKLAQKQASLEGTEAARINFGLSKTLDNIVNPIDKYLDDTSKLVYNYGTQFPTSPTGKLMIKAGDQRINDLIQVMKGIDSNYTSQDAVIAAKGYSMMLNKLKEIDGKNFSARSFDDFVKNKELNNDLMIKLFNAGEFDGC